MKIRPVEAELLHADRPDGQTVMKKLTVVFRNFANAPKKSELIWISFKIYFLPHRKYVNTVAVKILWPKVLRKIMFNSENQTKFCELNVQFFNFKPARIYIVTVAH